MTRYILLTFFLTIQCSHAAVIDFESGFDPAFTYLGGIAIGDLTGVTEPSGYVNVSAFTSSAHLAANAFESSPTDYLWNEAGTFDLNSFVFAGAWGTQTFTFQGFLDGVMTENTSFFATLDASLVTLDWMGIDQFRILTGDDFIQDPSLLGSGQHYAIDNITYSVSEVPVPAAAWLMGSGLLGLLGFGRKNKVQTVAV